jgi:hypothetical protein
MGDFRVTCITKPNPQSTHEHITHIGGLDNGEGKPWNITSLDFHVGKFD